MIIHIYIYDTFFVALFFIGFHEEFQRFEKILRFYLILFFNSFSIILGRSNHTKEVVRMNREEFHREKRTTTSRYLEKYGECV